MAGRAGRRVYSSAAWKRVRWAALERADFRCEACSSGRLYLEVHHRRSLSSGGEAFSLSNLQVLCRPCHWRATAAERKRLSPGESAWAELMEEL